MGTFSSASETAAGVSSSVRNALSIGGISTGQKNESLFPSMGYQTRMTGFAACFITGVLLSVLASFFLWTGGIALFAIFYTLGNVALIFSVCFLVGPRKQCAAMFKRNRVLATIIFFSSLAATLLVAFLSSRPALPCLLLIIVQFLAGIWYSLSYIPYARQFVKSCFKGTADVSGVV